MRKNVGRVTQHLHPSCSILSCKIMKLKVLLTMTFYGAKEIKYTLKKDEPQTGKQQLIHTVSQIPTSLHYKARKYGEATEKIKDNEELCDHKERREQLT